MQLLQLVALVQGSPASTPTLVHAELIHAQLPALQVVPLGPELVPGRQLRVAAHQPHCARAVQVSQFVALEQGSPASTAVMQDDRVHAQFDAQVEPVGPVLVPLWQRPVAPHQPHCDSAVHVSHIVWLAQGSLPLSTGPVSTGPVSTGPVSGVPASGVPVSGGPASGAGQVVALLVHPTAQEPALGPEAPPARHEFVSPHQPQGPREVHVPQDVTAPQLTVVCTSGAAGTSMTALPPSTDSCALEHDAARAPSTRAEAKWRCPMFTPQSREFPKLVKGAAGRARGYDAVMARAKTAPTRSPRRNTPAEKPAVAVNSALKKRYATHLAAFQSARADELSGWDAAYEALDAILSAEPPLYLAGGFKTAKAFLATVLPGVAPSTVRDSIRVARHFDPQDEKKHGTSKLALLLDYLEARANGPLPRAQINPDTTKIQASDDRRGTLADFSYDELRDAVRRQSRTRARTDPPEVRALRAVFSAKGLGNVALARSDGRWSFGRVEDRQLADLAAALASYAKRTRAR